MSDGVAAVAHNSAIGFEASPIDSGPENRYIVDIGTEETRKSKTALSVLMSMLLRVQL